jgi:hypothetical protein
VGGSCDDRPTEDQLGISTLSITWMTPFDWNTFWIETLEALPLESRMVSTCPLNSTVSSSPSTVLNLALPPPLLDASHRSLTECRPGRT